MNDADYPEIVALNEMYIRHKVWIKTDRSQLLGGKDYYPLVHVELSGQQFDIFVDDEYDDLKYNYPILNLCLVLRELEGYAWAQEYETWCQERYFNPADAQVRHNHRHLSEVHATVKQILGEIDSKVSDFDFEMNAGAAWNLRKLDRK